MHNKMTALVLAGIFMMNQVDVFAQNDVVSGYKQTQWRENSSTKEGYRANLDDNKQAEAIIDTKEEAIANEETILSEETIANETIGNGETISNGEAISSEEAIVSKEAIVSQEVIGNKEAIINEEDKHKAIGVEEKVVLTLNSKKVLLYGEERALLAAPKVVQGRTYLPLRFVGEEILKADVYWDSSKKEIKVKNNTTEVQLKVGSKKAYLNGKEVYLDVPPLIEKGTTLLPLRFMSEQFNLPIEYFEKEKRIEIEKPYRQEEVEGSSNTMPVAKFEFVDESYTEGQEVRIIDLSFDPDGDYIAQTLWRINNDSNKTASQLQQLFKKPKAGTYEIALKVRDNKGMWSEWETRTITIVPNKAPEITELKTVKVDYGQGEPIEFKHTYDNESWENIKAERWTYRAVTDPENNTLFIKPQYIFSPGEYIVTLELQDEAGNWSQKKQSTIQITSEVLMTEFEYKFNQGSIGDTIDNFQGTNYRNYKSAEIQNRQDIPGTLIMSNSPEVVKEKGILYRDTVTGKGRVLVHHINDFNEHINKKRLVIIAKNNDTKLLKGTIEQLTMKGPASDVLYVGQQLLYDYFNSHASARLDLAVGETKVIYDSKNKNWNKGDAISGMFNFDIQGEVTFTVAALDEADKIETVDSMNMPPRDVHPRGTFNVINKNYTIDLSEEIENTKVILGNGAEEWVTGVDALTGEESANKGNFGVEYHLRITVQEDTAVILNPRGNMFKGAIKWKGDKGYLTPNKGYFPNSNRATFLGTLKAGETKELIYILPNGSSAPVLFGFIPKTQWGK